MAMSMSRVRNWAAVHEQMEGAPPAANSVRLDGLGSGFDDLPQLAVGPVVPDAAMTVGPFLLKRAETNKLAKLLSDIALRDDFTWRFGLKEPRLVMASNPQGQCQAGWAPEEQLANLVHVHWRVPLTNCYLLSRI